VRRAAVVGPLADRPFRLLWLAATTSAFGSAFVPVALAFAVLGIGGNATSLGLVLLAGTIAGLSSYLVAGVWADRVSRRTLMLTADLVRLVVELAVAVALLTGHAQIWQLALASVLVAVATAFEGPASIGLVAEVVTPAGLQQANSLLSIGTRAAAVLGPALSGLLVAAAGAGWAFAVDAASFAGSAAFLLAMPALGRSRPARQRFFSELAAGWREVTSRSWVWATLAGNSISNMAFATFLVLGPVLARERLGGASGWGLVSSGMTAGAILAGLLTLSGRFRRPVAVGLATSTLLALPILALAARLPLAAVVAFAIVGLSGGFVFDNHWDTAIQQLIPGELLSRFRSYDYLLAFVAMPIGCGLAGPLAHTFSADHVMVAAAAVIVVANGVPATLPSVRGVVRTPDGTITGPAPKPSADVRPSAAAPPA
jgi:MFS family permease